MSFVSHVECTICGDRQDPKRLLTVCARCGQMLVVRYDLERVKTSVSKDALRQRPPGMYRFRELTPLRSEEHTSELQSQSNLVCRLLLEKKKKKKKKKNEQQL